MLRATLTVAAGLGIERALLTTDAGNVGSQRVITTAGGVREPGDGPDLRFWLPTR